MSDVTWVSTIVIQTRSKPALDGCTSGALPCELLLDALEDQHVRIHAHPDRQDQSGDSRQGHRDRDARHEPNQNEQVQHDGDQRVEAVSL